MRVNQLLDYITKDWKWVVAAAAAGYVGGSLYLDRSPIPKRPEDVACPLVISLLAFKIMDGGGNAE